MFILLKISVELTALDCHPKSFGLPGCSVRLGDTGQVERRAATAFARTVPHSARLNLIAGEFCFSACFDEI